MNPKTFLSKTTSVLASLVLALGGSLIATQPAAAVPTVSVAASVAGDTDKESTLTRTAAVWSDSSTGTGAWYVCTNSGVAATSVPADCKILYDGSSGTTPFSNSTYFITSLIYCDSNCPMGVNSAGKYIRWIETSGGATSASASVGPVLDTASSNMATTAGSATVTLQLSCTISGTPTITGFTFTVNSSARSISSASTSGNTITFTLASNLTSGDLVALNYARSGSPIACTNNNVIPATLTKTQTVSSGGGGGGSVSTCVINGVTQTAITSMAFTVTTLTASNAYRLYYNGNSTLSNCMFPVSPGFGSIALLNGSVIGTGSYIATSGLGYGPSITTRTLSQLLAGTAFNGVTVVDGDIYTLRIFPNSNSAPTSSSTGYVEASMTLMPGAGQSNGQVSSVVERLISTPVFQAPILNSLAPKMTSGFSSTGGKLVLKDVKPTDISSVLLNGKKVEVVASKSGAALRIPAGAGAGDLQFTMADGTVINVANAVKITPSQVNSSLVDLIPLAATYKSAASVAVPAAIKNAITKRAGIIAQSDSAKCVGYASSNTPSARAVALTRAANVCGVITDINEAIDPIIKVVVNKTVSKKTPVKYQTW